MTVNAIRSPIKLATWLIALAIGFSLGIVLLLANPQQYFDLQRTVGWRFKLPSVAQVGLEQTMIALQLRGEALVRPTDMLVFGDSHAQALPATLFGGFVNYAIGGETLQRLAVRIQRYASVKTARAVLIFSGTNDIAQNSDTDTISNSMAHLLAHLTANLPVNSRILVVGLLPTAEFRMPLILRLEINLRFKTLCTARPGCQYVDPEFLASTNRFLDPQFAEHDGLHLNHLGYQVLAQNLAKAIHLHDSQRPAL